MSCAHKATRVTSWQWHCNISAWACALTLLCSEIGHPSVYTVGRGCLYPFIMPFTLQLPNVLPILEVSVKPALCISPLRFSMIYEAIESWTRAKLHHQTSWFNQNYQSLLIIRICLGLGLSASHLLFFRIIWMKKISHEGLKSHLLETNKWLKVNSGISTWKYVIILR